MPKKTVETAVTKVSHQGPANPDNLGISSLHIRHNRGGLKLRASQEAV
jgi:hypothetical protein